MKRAPLILVAREFDEFSSRLKGGGCEIINFPVIRTVPVEDLSRLREKLLEPEKYDGLFFTSPKAAEVFLQNFENKAGGFRGKIYALGGRTKALLETAGFETVSGAQANTAEEFINSFGRKSEFAGKNFLFLRGDRSLRTVPELLSGTAARIDEVVVYRTVEASVDENLAAEIREKLRGAQIDWICFFSPSGIESFLKTFGDFSPAGEIKIAAVGTTTASCAAGKNLKVDFVSPRASAEDFAFGLIEHLKNEAKARARAEKTER